MLKVKCLAQNLKWSVRKTLGPVIIIRSDKHTHRGKKVGYGVTEVTRAGLECLQDFKEGGDGGQPCIV